MKYMLLLLMLVCFTASAKSPTLVTTLTSESNQSLDDFALSIAKQASRESMLLGAEVCGEFQKQGNVYVIELYSTDMTMSCDYNKRASDASYTGLSFHTHLRKYPNEFSDGDYGHPGYLAHGSAVQFQNGRDTVRILRR